MSENTEKKYKIGYKQPPPHSAWKKGQSGNPGGRPKNSMKDYVKRKLAQMSDEEKEKWLEEHKIPGLDLWKMAEGNPSTDSDITSAGEKIVIMPIELINKNKDDATS